MWALYARALEQKVSDDMARTAPVPNLPPIPGMCPSVAVAGGGGAGGGSGGNGPGGGSGHGPGSGGGGAAGTGGDGKEAPDPKKYPLCGTKSHPVDVVTGRAFTHPICDFEIDGPVDLVFERSASSAIFARDFGLGPGWAHSLGWQIELRRDAVWVFTEMGTKIAFPLLEPGAEALGPFGWRLRRDQHGYDLDADDEVFRRFDLEIDQRVLLTQVRDSNDNKIVLAYAGEGVLEKVIDSAGRELRVRTDERGHILGFAIRDASGEWLRLAEYQYDDLGRLVRATDPDGHAHQYAYNDRNQLVLDQDRAGLCFHFVFGDDGRCIESWGDYGARPDPSLVEGLPPFLHDGVTPSKGIHHCIFEWGTDGYSSITDSTQSSSFFGNAFGLIDKMVEGGSVTTATYRADGHLLSTTDGEGATDSYQRDRRGRITKTVDPLGRTTAIERDDYGGALRVIDPAGGETVVTRDFRGNLLGTLDPAGAITTFEIDSRGNVIKITDAVGGVTRYVYDPQCNLVEMTQPDGAVWRYAYDLLGRCVAETDPAGATTRYVFTLRGDLISVFDALGNEERYQYDGEGRIIEHRSALGFVTRYEWGGYDRLVSQTDENGNVVRFGYNVEGELTHVWNEKGDLHRLEYGSFGLLKHEKTFDGRSYHYQHDKAERVIKILGSDERATEYGYDLAGQLVSRTFHDGESDVFEYDVLGEIVKAVSPGGVECSFARNPVGEVIREVQKLRGKAHEVSVTLDEGGERVRRATSLGHVEEIRRDKMGNRASTTLDGRAMTHTFDRLGREVRRELAAGGRLESLYDPMGRLAERRTSNPVRDIAIGDQQPDWIGKRPEGITTQKTFRYDADGRLTEAWDRKRGGTEYRYDPVGQLLAMVPAQARAQLFRYDRAGNLFDDGAGAEEREYGAGDRLLRKGNTFYRWDAEGRLVEKRTKAENGEILGILDHVWNYSWTPAGLMSRAESSEGVVAEYVYDAFARRLEKRISRRSSDNKRDILEKRVRFVWDGDTLVHEIREEGIASANPVVEERTYLFEEDGYEPLAHCEKRSDDPAKRQGVWFHYVNDPNGTPEKLVDEHGDVACELERGAWGEASSTGPSRASTPIRLKGQYADEETGLFYQRWRYYDEGLFISPDPLGLDAGEHAYGFAPNAFEWDDPLGLYKQRKNNGQFAAKPGPKPKKNSTNGNSKNSSKPTLLYAMVNQNTGKFQKWGITDKVKNPSRRYGKKMPRNCALVEAARGKRSAMLKLERELTEKQPGPRNKEPWKGKKKGQPLGKKAAKAKAQAGV